jgi:hypothetical protein
VDGGWVHYGDCEDDSDCTGCQSCEGCYCTNDEDPCGDCKECVSGECVVIGDGCLEDSDCGDCETCIGCKCWCFSQCGCESSVGCSDCTECVDCECQLKSSSECASLLDCPLCHDCIDCNCVDLCTADECCQEGVGCVTKCDADGDSCDWTYPGVQSMCPAQNDNDNWQCEPGVEGLTCNWEILETYHTTSAECAACATDCKERTGNCVKLKARVCKFVLVFGCGCCEVDNPPTCFRGDYYECK